MARSGTGESEAITRIQVHLHPGSSRDALLWNGRLLEVWVRQAPIRGAANSALIEKVARWLEVPRASVAFASGRRVRTKTLEVRGLPGGLPPPHEAV